jgi:hypothetical protein
MLVLQAFVQHPLALLAGSINMMEGKYQECQVGLNDKTFNF